MNKVNIINSGMTWLYELLGGMESEVCNTPELYLPKMFNLLKVFNLNESFKCLGLIFN